MLSGFSTKFKTKYVTFLESILPSMSMMKHTRIQVIAFSPYMETLIENSGSSTACIQHWFTLPSRFNALMGGNFNKHFAFSTKIV